MSSRLSQTPIWLVYCLIVFEILFMVSPLALYYYAAYRIPLTGLASHSETAWLVQYVLPHYADHQSSSAKFLILISWPLIFFGLALFLLAFTQIYWAKFTHKGAVVVGLYRWIRHPQYLALALVGLGTTLFWSRFLIIACYLSMLFLYYLLARHEEAQCLKQFGSSYAQYLKNTGRFWPRLIKGNPAPTTNQIKTLPLTLLYCSILVAALLAASTYRNNIIRQLNIWQTDNLTFVALAPEAELTIMAKFIDQLDWPTPENQHQNYLIYALPKSWSIPELGLKPYNLSAQDELKNPSHHGNSLDFDKTAWQLLVCEAQSSDQKPLSTQQSSFEVIQQTFWIKPLFSVVFDLNEGVVTNAVINAQPEPSPWQGIPVPIY